MKPTKKKTAKRKNGDTPKGMLIMKLKKLGTAIEMKKGTSMDIDDPHYRWVDDKISYMEQGTYKFTKEDMKQPNELWRLYG